VSAPTTSVTGPTGVLLVNLGTPDAPEAGAVRRYLRQFLSDPRVLDMHPAARWALLELVILPRRPAASAAAYRKVWLDEGSPLLVHGHALTREVRERLSPDRHRVELAMRYGQPSIDAGLSRLREAGCDRIVVVPLYPQYASSSTGSTVEEVYRLAGQHWNTPFITVVPPFFDDARFIEAFASVTRPVLDDMQPDHVLLSFHGLPERHMIKSDETAQHCLRSETCCDRVVSANRNCYRAQCFATARALASKLELSDDGYTVSFQSRLGRAVWIRPYTDELLVELPKRGVRKLAVVCPAFVADCLETLEEIGIRASADFQAAGGTELRLVPSLNAAPAWVDAVTSFIHDADLGSS
jgi:protoporphyrin/coproporphyrin ferrochelatase